MPHPTFSIDPAAFARYPWGGVIGAASAAVCYEYCRGFSDEAKKLTDAGDQIGGQVYSALGAISSFSFRPRQEGDNPYGAFWQEPTQRSPHPDDLGPDGLTLLRTLAPAVTDPDFRGRLFDLIWILGRDFKAVAEAARAYTLCATELARTKNWVHMVVRADRALQLSGRLGRNKGPFTDAVKVVEDTLVSRQAVEDEFISADLLDLLHQHRAGDPARWAKHAEDLALRPVIAKNVVAVRRYWDFAQLFWRAAGNDRKMKAAAIAAAETHVIDADAALARKTPSYMSAARCIADAIDALRKAGGSKQRIGVLKRRMLAYQRRSVHPKTGELGSFSRQIDLSKSIATARAGVAGKSLPDALLWLARAIPPLGRDALRNQTITNAQQNPLLHFIGAFMMDLEGKPIAQKPSASPGSPDQQEAAIEAQMWMDAKQHREVIARGLILPAIRAIREEHEPRITDLIFLVLHSPVVAEGREELFARGLLAGLRHDFAAAAHYLLPQIENSIRHVLTKRGVIASGLDNDLLQTNFGLKALFEMPATERIFGENFIFDLRGLLIEKLGSNLRNEFAHGLIPFHEFMSPEVIYLWGQCLRLAALPVLAYQEAKASRAGSGKDGDGI